MNISGININWQKRYIQNGSDKIVNSVPFDIKDIMPKCDNFISETEAEEIKKIYTGEKDGILQSFYKFAASTIKTLE